jgi:hypothetical protein
MFQPTTVAHVRHEGAVSVFLLNNYLYKLILTDLPQLDYVRLFSLQNNNIITTNCTA